VARITEQTKSASSSSSHKQDSRLVCGQCELKSAHVVSILTTDIAMPLTHKHALVEYPFLDLLASYPLNFYPFLVKLAFNVLKLSVGRQEEHPASKN